MLVTFSFIDKYIEMPSTTENRRFAVCQDSVSEHDVKFYCESSQTESPKTIQSSVWWQTGLLKRTSRTSKNLNCLG